MNVDIFTDGGARGNPGPAGIGVVIKHNGKTIEEYRKFLGEATNNQAEYEGVHHALLQAKKLGVTEIAFYLDSELVVSQLKQEFKIKNEILGKIFIKIWNLSQHFKKISYQWIPREQNDEADKLVNQAIDEAV